MWLSIARVCGSDATVFSFFHQFEFYSSLLTFLVKVLSLSWCYALINSLLSELCLVNSDFNLTFLKGNLGMGGCLGVSADKVHLTAIMGLVDT